MDAPPPLWRQAERLARQGAAEEEVIKLALLSLLWLAFSLTGCFTTSQRAGQQGKEVPYTKAKH